MAMKDFLDRIRRTPEEELPEELPETPQVNYEVEVVDTIEETPAEPVRRGPVRVNNPNDNERIQTFEINLGGSKVTIPEEEEEVVAPAAPADTITVAPEPVAEAPEDEYAVDFGYEAPGALDDVTYTTDPAATAAAAVPAAPEPVVIQKETPVDEEPEYYDSYEPVYEESYPGKNFFAPAPDKVEPYIAPEEPVAAEAVSFQPEPATPKAPEAPVAPVAPPQRRYEPEVREVEVSTPVYEEPEPQPRYENYRKDYAATADKGPRSYENNIDDSVFLPDEGDAPVNSSRNRRRLITSLVALLLALLVVLGAIFLSHHNKKSDSNAPKVTVAAQKTTAFERSVSNNADATSTTVEEELGGELSNDGEEISSETEAETRATTRRTTEATTARSTSTTARSTSSTTRSTTATTASTTRVTTTTTVATTVATTTAPTTAPTTRATTAADPDRNNPWNGTGGNN